MGERRALAIARDRTLLAGIDRIAAVAGCELDVADGAHDARRSWSAAPLVLVGADAVTDCVAAGLPRRAGVVVVCPGEPPPALWQHALHLGADAVVGLPAAESWLAGALAEAVGPAPGSGPVIAVLGGRGGAGASVLAAALALVALRRGERSLLVDCDPLGGGADHLLGAEHADGLRWPQLDLGNGRVAAESLHAALPAVPAAGGRVTVLACDRDGAEPEPAAVAAVVESGRRAGDVVVCDVPRHLADAGLAAVDRADLVVVVVPADVRSCAAATPLAARLRSRGAPARLVVRGPSPGGVAPVDVSRALGLPLLTAMRPAPGIAAVLDAGRLPIRSRRSPLAKAAAAVLDAAGAHA